MSYNHGVYVSEIPTAVVPPVELDSPAVIIGTAPVNRSSDGVGKTNVPVLCYSLDEAVDALGYSGDWEKYTLCEAMYTFFQLFAVAPVVFINVLDPANHKESVSPAAKKVTDGQIVLDDPDVLPGSVTVTSEDGNTTYVKDTDYVVAWNDNGYLCISAVEGGAIAAGATVKIGWDKLTPSAVTSDDIIGGYNGATGRYEGLELVEQVYPRLRLVPGLILAPGWSHESAVAAIMAAKAESVNGVFRSLALADVPADACNTYSSVPGWKNDNNYVQEQLVCCWPKVKLGDNVFHMSTQVAALMMATDGDNGGIPYVSPSNHGLQADGATVGGTGEEDEVSLTLEQANYLNSQGVVTALNFIGGWRCWGNRTACYPGSTDVKDSFIPVKRMFIWKGNQLVLTYWQKVDAPTNKRLIQTIVDSENINLNGLAARGILVGSNNKVEFLEDDNPTTDLLNGIIRFHLLMTPPVPARSIEWELEFDTSNLQSLFG